MLELYTILSCNLK